MKNCMFKVGDLVRIIDNGEEYPHYSDFIDEHIKSKKLIKARESYTGLSYTERDRISSASSGLIGKIVAIHPHHEGGSELVCAVDLIKLNYTSNKSFHAHYLLTHYLLLLAPEGLAKVTFDVDKSFIRFPVGTTARIIDTGLLYTTYQEWVHFNAPKYLAKYTKTQDLRFSPKNCKAEVVAVGRHHPEGAKVGLGNYATTLIYLVRVGLKDQDGTEQDLYYLIQQEGLTEITDAETSQKSTKQVDKVKHTVKPNAATKKSKKTSRKSKYLGMIFTGQRGTEWEVKSCENVNKAHKRFFLQTTNSANETCTIMARDNLLTALRTGKRTIDNVITNKFMHVCRKNRIFQNTIYCHKTNNTFIIHKDKIGG